MQMKLKPYKTQCEKILNDIRGQKGSNFIESDAGFSQLADYERKIPNPLSLFGVKKKLESNKYHILNEFATDVRTIFGNFARYNYQVLFRAVLPVYVQSIVSQSKTFIHIEPESESSKGFV